MKARGFALVGLGMLASCTFPEERQKNKPVAPVCPPEPPTKGMVLATIHEFHLANSSYPFAKLGDALDAYRPDLILVDVPQETLKGAHPEDGPIDLEYIKYIAGTRSTEVAAIGPDREDPAINAHADKADEDTLAREGGSFDPMALNMTFEAANGVEGTHKLVAELNTRARLMKGNPDWVRHEAWLEHATDKLLNDRKPKRVLAIVDPMFRPALEAHLYEMGLGMMNPAKVVAESKEKRDENAVPAAILSVWSEHLNQLQDRLPRMRGGQDRSWLEYNVSIYQIAVDKHGTCCVTLDMLRPPGSTTSTTPPTDQRPIDRRKPK